MGTALRHMMLHEDTLADEFEAILGYRTTHEGIVLPGTPPWGDEEQLVRLSTAGGDYLSLAVGSPPPNPEEFTILWRARMAQDNNTSMGLQLRTSAGASVLQLRRVNSGSGNLITLFLIGDFGTIAGPTAFGTAPGDSFLSTDGVRTYVLRGSMASGEIHCYLVAGADTEVGSAMAWPTGEPLLFADDNETGFGDLAEITVGRENVTVRSDQDLSRIVFWTSAIADLRTICDADGIPVENMPGSPLVDLTAANGHGSVHLNAGSLGDFTANGAPYEDVT